MTSDEHTTRASSLDSDQLEQTLQRWSVCVPPDATPSTTLRDRPAPSDHHWSGLLRPVEVSHRGEPAPGVFDLLDTVGEGGMGEVLAARQVSLDRIVALKRLHPGSDSNPADRHRFLAEAVVTGDLDHPNIVPVHELASTPEGTPFYVMKLVRGTSWDRVIDTMSEDENLDIVLKVADAVAFAHSRGVIHRDLKPHNVMLGDYGEVLVMDWGLAVSITRAGKASPLDRRSAFGGTAAYMPPEMALGEIDRIGVASDVYLLGAVLYRILTGRAPHDGATVMASLAAAARNDIADSPRADELMEIARQAMATAPESRFADVPAFQTRLREARFHSQSRRLMDRAAAALAQAAEAHDYSLYERARYGFEEAAALWPENSEGADGARQARLAQARAAFERQDLELAASLVTGDGADERTLARQVSAARRTRDGRQRRLRTLRRVAAGLAAALVVVLGAGLLLITAENRRAERAERLANSQSEVALDTLDALVYSVNDALADRPGMQDLREDLLSVAVAGLEKVVAAEQESGTVDRRLAVAHQSLARIAYVDRQIDRAQDHQRVALDLFRALHDPADIQSTVDLARAWRLMGEIQQAYRMGDLEAARHAVEEARHIAALLPADHPEAEDLDFQLRFDLVDLAIDGDQLDEAEALARDLLRDAEARSGTADDESRRFLAQALSRLSEVAVYRDQAEEALVFSRRRLATLESLASSPAAGDPEVTRLLALAEQDLGDTLRRVNDLAGAEIHLARARRLQEELIRSDPTRGQVRRDLVTTLWSQGELAAAQDLPDRAMDRYLAALSAAEGLLDLNPANLEAIRDVFICAKEVGWLHLAADRPERARPWLERSREMTARLIAAQPEALNPATDHAISLYNLGLADQAAGDCAAATAHWSEALDLLAACRERGQITPDSRFAPWFDEFEQLIESCSGGGPGG